MSAPRPFGRDGELVNPVWRERSDGVVMAGSWTGLIVEPNDLQRRSGDRVRAAAAAHGRPFDFFLARGLSASDLKVGGPTHALLKFRSEKLGRHLLIHAADVLEAEWIVTHAPVQGVVIAYAPDDMAARYRVFDAATNGGVTLVGRAETAEAAALQLATAAITATLLAADLDAPMPLSADVAESLWSAYTATHGEPPKLRGGHPPDEG